MDKENYSVAIKVRDKNGNRLFDTEGNPRPREVFDILLTNRSVESYMRDLGRTLITWMPEHRIDISISLYDNISGTYPVMFTFYVEENKFIKH